MFLLTEDWQFSPCVSCIVVHEDKRQKIIGDVM
jgi:hypothetical protein